MHITNIFAPESTPAQSIFDLSMFVLAITGIIFVVVAALLVYAIVKFRATGANADREPAQVYGSTSIELAWTIVPLLIVVVLFLGGLQLVAIGVAGEYIGRIYEQAMGRPIYLVKDRINMPETNRVDVTSDVTRVR